LTHAIERGLGRRRGTYGLGQIEARPGEQLADLRQLVADATSSLRIWVLVSSGMTTQYQIRFSGAPVPDLG